MTDKDSFEYTNKHSRCRIYGDSYSNKLVFVKMSALPKEFQFPEYQFQYVVYHNPPKIFGTRLKCISVYDSSSHQFELQDILGVVLKKYLPEWAKVNLFSLLLDYQNDETI